MKTVKEMNRVADNIRLLTAAMVEKAKSGHPGGAMGGADFINVLFSEYLIYDPQNPEYMGRDRFFLDPGHMAPMLYSALTFAGFYELEDMKHLRQWGSTMPGHPERNLQRGIENTSGPLGQGHTNAVGAAIAAKFLQHKFGPVAMPQRIYTFISDGGIQEEISQGAGRIAGRLGLDNLIMFYDSNGIQLSSRCDVTDRENVRQKYEAWGWWVTEIDGNNVSQIRRALNAALEVKGKPALIIGHTIMGKGALKADGTSYENNCSTHGAPLGGDAYVNTIKNLGGNPDDPFVIFPETQQLYAERRAELIRICAERKEQYAVWAKKHYNLSRQLVDFFSHQMPEVHWEQIVQKPDCATRAASSAVLGQLAKDVDNMLVSSADLSNSDKTDGFLKQTQALSEKDFSGRFLQAGVSELTMACICIGMAQHGGIIPACATFFVFSDYMKPALRMAALQELPVKFIFSHDAFRVGEDGPTHEPVEQEMQLRLLEKLQNHSGKNSMLVLRPADAQETTICWRMAMENQDTPTALILSRQNIKSLPEDTNYELVRKGAYVVSDCEGTPDVVLLASGSEVSTLMAGAELLRQDGVRLRVVSVPSEGLFLQQPKEYQESVLPRGVKRFGLTAGLSVTLEHLVGENGRIWGMNSFGFSGPYKVLDEKLGFTAENVYTQVKELLNSKD